MLQSTQNQHFMTDQNMFRMHILFRTAHALWCLADSSVSFLTICGALTWWFGNKNGIRSTNVKRHTRAYPWSDKLCAANLSQLSEFCFSISSSTM